METKFKKYIKWLSNYKTKLEPIKPAILAMSILETGWGKSKLFQEHNNAHGQKFREFLAHLCERVNYLAHDGVDVYCAFDNFEYELKSLEYRLTKYPGYRGWDNALSAALPNLTFISVLRGIVGMAFLLGLTFYSHPIKRE